MKLISIVMPVLNREKLVGEAISSVIAQDYHDWELIVVDNGSTDGTVKVVKEFMRDCEGISLHIYSEKRGEYPATNYGIRNARGEIIGILHSDDMYAEGALRHVAEKFSENHELDVLCPRVIVMLDSGGVTRIERVVQTDLKFESLIIGKPLEPARFFRKRVYEIIGPIDENYKYSGFREWWIRASLKPGIKWRQTSQICYIYRRHAGSATAPNKFNALRYLPEHYPLITKLLKSQSVDEAKKKLLKHRWFNDSYSGFFISLSLGRIRSAIWFAAMGTRVEPLWAVKAIKKKISGWLRPISI